MRKAERVFEIHKQAEFLTRQVTSLRQYLEDNGGGMWKDVVKTELMCMLERFAIIERESSAEINAEYNMKKAS